MTLRLPARMLAASLCALLVAGLSTHEAIAKVPCVSAVDSAWTLTSALTTKVGRSKQVDFVQFGLIFNPDGTFSFQDGDTAYTGFWFQKKCSIKLLFDQASKVLLESIVEEAVGVDATILNFIGKTKLKFQKQLGVWTLAFSLKTTGFFTTEEGRRVRFLQKAKGLSSTLLNLQLEAAAPGARLGSALAEGWVSAGK